MKRLILLLCLGFFVGESFSQVDTLDIDEVTISASKANDSDPVTFQNISAKAIEKIYFGQNPTVLLEQLSPSIVTYGDGGANLGNYVNFRMRGITHSRINKTLDGVPLDDMVDQATYFSNFSDFGNSLGGIQIQRGVGTSNNGIASFAGSINFESPKLYSMEKGGEAQILTGSFNTFRGAAEVRTGLMENGLSFYGRMSRTTSDGYKNGSSSDATSFFISGGYFGEKDVIKFTAFSGKSERGQAYLPVLLSDIQSNPKTNYNHSNDIDDFEQELVLFKYSRLAMPGLTWNTTAYYGGARGVFPFSIDNATQFVYGVKNDHYGLFSDINIQSGSWNIKGGIHAYTFDRDNFEYVAPDANNPYDSDATAKDELSLFGKVNYQSGRLNLSADLQLRNVSLKLSPVEYRDRDWTFFNPKIGLTYTLDDYNNLYASFGRSGREPTRSDIRNSDDIIVEEYVNDIEIGWRSQGSKLNINANFFFMDFENEISLVGALQELSYIDIRTNVSSSSRVGVEVESQYRWSDQVSLGLNAAFLRSNVKSYEGLRDVEQVFSPSLILSPNLNIQFSNNFGVRLSGQYVSESFIELSNRSDYTAPSFFIANIQLNAELSKAISISASMNNLFNELYFTDGAPVDFDYDGIPEGPGYRVQPPRNAYLMLKVGF